MQLKQPLVAADIVVRSHLPADEPFIRAMWQDAENGRYMTDPLFGYEDEKWLAAVASLAEEPDGYYLTVTDRRTGEIVGTACVFPDRAGRVYDIGYCIHKSRWRQGLGTQLVRLLLDWIRAAGGQAVTAEVACDNAGSNQLLRHFGFTVLRRSSFKKYNMDVCFDSCVYQLVLRP